MGHQARANFRILEDVFVAEFALVGACAPGAFHLIHRAVGDFEEGVDIGAIIGVAGVTDAGCEWERASFEAEGLIRFQGYAFDDSDEIGAGGDFAEDYAELVASETGNNVRPARDPADAQGGFANSGIARAMTEGVIDTFKSVEIDEENAQRLDLAATREGSMAEAIEEESAIGKPGQRIVRCLLVKRVGLITCSVIHGGCDQFAHELEDA